MMTDYFTQTATRWRPTFGVNTDGTPSVRWYPPDIEDAEQVIEAGEWASAEFIAIENQNYDGSDVSVASVTGSVDGELELDVDYTVSVEEGVTGIFLDLVNEDQDITITYDYMPAPLTISGVARPLSKAVEYTNDKRTVYANYRWYCESCDLTETDELEIDSVRYKIAFVKNVMSMDRLLQVDLYRGN